MRELYPHFHQSPQIDPTVFLAEGSRVYGDVHIGRDSSIWFNTVIRGDVNYIRIGEESNVQDNSVIHVEHDVYPTVLGTRVTVGHSVTLHGCVIEATKRPPRRRI